MTEKIELLLHERSPFLPEFDSGVFDKILNDLYSDPSYYPGEAIAKHLVYVGLSQSIQVFGEMEKFKMTPQDVAQYTSGFSNPLRLLQISYAGAADGVAAARYILSQHESSPDTDFLAANLEHGVRLLQQDPTGRNLINSVVQSVQSGSIYYKVGLEAARRTFAIYAEKIQARGFRANPFPP